MAANDYFVSYPNIKPTIYAYEDNGSLYRGMLRIGYTNYDVDRVVAQQYPTVRPGGVPYRIVFSESAVRNDGTSFTATDIHRTLENKGFSRYESDWFRCSINDLRSAWKAVMQGSPEVKMSLNDFGMRPEQEDAVNKTIAYFQSSDQDSNLHIPKFLWNAKMRFGKTFATYQLAKKMGFKRILILTFKPAVQSAWRSDLLTHKDFDGWQFISRPIDVHQPNIDAQYAAADKNKTIVCFGSFQDFLGIDKATGGIKPKNEWVHSLNWDLVVFDEYHFGAWKDSAKKLFDKENEDEFDSEDLSSYDRANAYDESFLPITTRYYLYLSGTPFRALNSGEFIEEQIYNWTYSDEQRAKDRWIGDNNPYSTLPRMVMMTYKLPEEIQRVAINDFTGEFDLNLLFKAEGSKENARFLHEREVQNWLDIIQGKDSDTESRHKPPMPYSDVQLLRILTHTVWFLPSVAACHAMRNLLKKEENNFFDSYTVNVCAGTDAGIGLAALTPIQESMEDPLLSKTITLTCGKLTTGVTIRPWSAIFMLRSTKSPETYFQSAFRVQSPWIIDRNIMKTNCYVFDFSLSRALKQIADYGCRLNINAAVSPEQKVAEFIDYLPVLAYDGNAMRPINAEDILDYAMSGTSATLLARRWESPLLVNVDNDTLRRLMSNQQAMAALMSIESFRNLNQDLQLIISKSEKVKEAKKSSEVSAKEKKEISKEEKECKNLRKQVQEKLIKFATRIPLFMYLTDYREETLIDVITKLEPDLFKRVTGLTTTDFELLVSLNVFNGELMNDAIYKFKRYEDSSLVYTGINRHIHSRVGLFDTSISRFDYEKEEFIKIKSSENTQLSFLDNATRISSYYLEEEQDDSLLKVAETTESYDITKNQRETDNRNQSAQDIINSSVRHAKFGIGAVKSVTNGIMIVAFNDGCERKFIYPDAIEKGYLTLI